MGNDERDSPGICCTVTTTTGSGNPLHSGFVVADTVTAVD
jgi:hypothetical protein